ncbi:hypothetical protein [Desulfopila aestuarii]|uniref:Uncharacterized protein n=1 Tax=Desulfopila aestuarii DSM 18488 TaxID=1121416 RepID=A0A1M7YJP5_9BACT|nr:hypothetical protein [Desulfopila aestuarii]SHO52832.1 hypothetical protein SAMN02745220_04791 [Desulfopila aestuarii DSM 18488]
MNLDTFNTGQLQDIKVFLGLCRDERLTVEQVLVAVDQQLQARIQPVEPRLHGPVPAKACPEKGCRGVMRLEKKGVAGQEEGVWHCLTCAYSEYVGVV